MASIKETAKPKYLIDEKGNKKAVVIDIKKYKSIIEYVEDLEDSNDLLKAEREATSFIPYDDFRRTWLKD